MWRGRSITIKENGKVEPKDAPIRRNGTIYFLTDDIEVTSGDGIRVHSDGITIDGKNHLIVGTDGVGIVALLREGVTIMDTRIQGFYYGIFATDSSDIEVTGNEVIDTRGGGICLSGSNIEITGNKFIGCGLYILNPCDNVVIKDNTINGRPLFFLEKKSHRTIKNVNIGQLILVRCNNIIVEELKIANTTVGIQLIETKDSVVRNNELMSNSNGIDLGHCSKNTIDENILENNEFGIYVASSQHNVISRNKVRRNKIGIGMWGSSDNRITCNTMESNEVGAKFSISSNNEIHHNNFITNKEQIVIEESENAWDDGSKGNYWSDSLGSNADGKSVGAPYYIDENNIDNYPLMHPFLFHEIELLEPVNNATLVPPVRFLAKVLSNGESVKQIPLTFYIDNKSINLLTDSNGYAELKDWDPRLSEVTTVEWWVETIKNGCVTRSEKRRLTCLPLPPPPEEEETVKDIEKKIEKVRGFLRKLESREQP